MVPHILVPLSSSELINGQRPAGLLPRTSDVSGWGGGAIATRQTTTKINQIANESENQQFW